MSCAHCWRPVAPWKAHCVVVEEEESTFHPDCCPGVGLCDLPWEH